MPSRRRGALFALLAGACAVAIVVAVVMGVREGDAGSAGSAAASELLPKARSDDRSMVVFRSLGGGAESKGHVALASPDGQPSQRTLTQMRCDRVYFTAGRGVCLARGGGFATGYRAKTFDSDLRTLNEVAVDGIPSRARVSPDGRYGSVTMFVSGHAYADAGSFSTQTTLLDLKRGQKVGDLESFTVTRGGQQVTAVDRNFWGVTFSPSDSDHFYATMATGGKTYLIEGSVSGRTAHTIRENVECPSISPDGTRIAFKKRTGSGTDLWHLTILDLESMRETPLTESRSVDDQVEWLDDDRVLYGVDGDIWTAAADGSGEPRRYKTDASSPAIARW